MRTVKCEFESYSGEEKEGLTAGEMLCNLVRRSLKFVKPPRKRWILPQNARQAQI